MIQFETHHTETPTHLNPLGAKGIGEASTIGSTPAVQNAVIDAISHLVSVILTCHVPLRGYGTQSMMRKTEPYKIHGEPPAILINSPSS